MYGTPSPRVIREPAVSDRRYDTPPRNRRALEQRLRNVMRTRSFSSVHAGSSETWPSPPRLCATHSFFNDTEMKS
jgi:hypothetical protein